MYKDSFILPENKIYMCGHSLGPTTKSSQQKVEEAMQDWSKYAVKAWNDSSWIDLPFTVSKKIAPLIGASNQEVIVSDSTSVNIFKVLISALKLNNKRNIILTTDDNFPADIYIAEGIEEFSSKTKVKTVKAVELLDHLDETVAVLMLTHVNYRNASAYDLDKITKYAHRLGIIIVWDLSHSVGIVPINLGACNADFAVGCTYKYLNGGPGSPAFIYVNERHHSKIESPIYGWMGHQQPFAFNQHYKATGVAKYLGGTPYIISLKSLEGALDVFTKFDLNHLHNLCLKHSSFLITALEQLNLNPISLKHDDRGGHVAFTHQQGYALSRALIDNGIICDYREPGLIRLCVNPLYLNINDIYFCIGQLQKILESKTYLLPKYQQKLKVT